MRSAGAWLPGLHGIGVMEPVGQKLPGVQASQAVEPAFAWKLPAMQLSHVDALS